jgi:integrase
VNGGHFATTTDAAGIGALLRAIHGYEGTFVGRCALPLGPLVFVRHGKLRAAEWSEFDFDKAEWRIPAERMKARVVHIPPLSTQAVAILRELQPLTRFGRYVFPSLHSPAQPMSENTINGALQHLPERRKMMQSWADFLDGLRVGSNVVPLKMSA